MGAQRQEGGWQGGKSQPEGALQIIPTSLSSETSGGHRLQINCSIIYRALKQKGGGGEKTEEERWSQVKALSEGSAALLWIVGCGADEDVWVEKQSIQMRDNE